MRSAYEKAGWDPRDVDLIECHATGTPVGDAVEVKAVRLLFKSRADKLAINATKSLVGHTLGAAGGVEAVITTLALEHGILPPTINYENPDPACDLDYVPNAARRQSLMTGMSNAFGFGGHNAVLAIRKY